MENIIQISQFITGIILIILILIQRSTGDVGGALSGEGSQFFQTRRGGEKFIFALTIIFSILFVGLSVFSVVIQTL